MLHRLGHKLGWTENDYKRELHNAWDVHSTNDLTKKQASDWISVLKDAAGEEDEPPAQQAPRQQDPAEPEWLAMAPDIGEAGADRWTQA